MKRLLLLTCMLGMWVGLYGQEEAPVIEKVELKGDTLMALKQKDNEFLFADTLKLIDTVQDVKFALVINDTIELKAEDVVLGNLLTVNEGYILLQNSKTGYAVYTVTAIWEPNDDNDLSQGWSLDVVGDSIRKDLMPEITITPKQATKAIMGTTVPVSFSLFGIDDDKLEKLFTWSWVEHTKDWNKETENKRVFDFPIKKTGPNRNYLIIKRLEDGFVYPYPITYRGKEACQVSLTEPSTSPEKPALLLIDKSLPLEVKFKGGNDDGWFVAWTENGDTLQTTAQYEIEYEDAKGYARHIQARVTNTQTEDSYPTPDVKLWCDTTFNYYVEFVPYPEAFIIPDKEGSHLRAGTTVSLGSKDHPRWEHQWLYNGQAVGTGSNYSFTAENVEEKQIIEVTHIVKCVDFPEVDSVTSTKKFTIWPEASTAPVVTPNAKEEPWVYLSTDEVPLEIRQEGGYDEGWTVNWIEDDDTLSVGNSFVVKNNAEKQNVTRIITARVENAAPEDAYLTDDNNMWYAYDYNYYVIFVDSIRIKIDNNGRKNLIEGETLSLTSNFDYENNHYNWVYEWSYNNELLSSKKNLNTNALRSDNEDGEPITVKLRASCNGYTTEDSVKIVLWPKPELSMQDIDTLFTCGGRTEELRASVKGGCRAEDKDNGWRFAWKEENLSDILCKDIVWLAPMVNDTIEKRKTVYVFSASNFCDGNEYEVGIARFPVVIYKKPGLDCTFTLKDDNRGGAEVTKGIREGNRLVVDKQENIWGGYPESWNEKWTPQEPQGGGFVLDGMNFTGNGKTTEVFSFEYTKQNLYNEIEWFSTTITKDVVVYRKPKTPVSLTKKGNGNSGTLIAMYDQADATLSELEYYLVFGYVDADGNSQTITSQKLEKDGTGRWTTNIPKEYLANNSAVYVYAVWRYDNQVGITSGLRYLSGNANEEWDGSSYNGFTRAIGVADPTSMEDIFVDNVNAVQNCESWLLNGMKTKMPGQGLYIIRMSDGSVKKVFKSK